MEIKNCNTRGAMSESLKTKTIYTLISVSQLSLLAAVVIGWFKILELVNHVTVLELSE